MNISFEDFKKLEIKIGKVINAQKVENADRLLKLEVDFSDFKRQIVSGIAEFYKPEELVGRQFPFLVNLDPKIFKGVESQGMLLAVKTDDKPVLLNPDIEVPPGSVIV